MVALAGMARDDLRRDVVATRMLSLCAQWTLVQIRGENGVVETQHNPHAAATLAYAYADAMIAVREAR